MLFFKVGNLRLILGEDFFFFLEITMIFRQKVGNLRLILGEDLFFLRDHYDFSTKSRKSETNFRRRRFFLEINVIFLEIKVKMALGSKTLDTPDVCGTKNFCMLLKLTKIFASLH